MKGVKAKPAYKSLKIDEKCEPKIMAVSSSLGIGEYCVSRTIIRDIRACLKHMKTQIIDETTENIFLIKLLELGYIQKDEQLSKQYGVPVFQVKHKWCTTKILQ